ncbi:MAG: LTA synthase family protein [Paludibacteraceae bacterium]|nr:LTA synthase family protein [Paludibacteraceae bacterium]
MSRLFFYFINLGIFTDVSFSHLIEMLGGGLRFDLTAVLYLSSVYLVLTLLPLPVKWRSNKVYSRVQKFFYIFPNAIGLLANSADMAYFRFSDHRTTCTFFSEFANETNLFSIFITSVFQFWYITLFAILLIIGLFILYKPYKPCLRNIKSPLYYTLASLSFIVCGFLTVVGIRGGLNDSRPITMDAAMKYVDRPAESSLVLNTPFCIIRTISYESLENPHYFADDQLDDIMSPIHSATCAPLLPGTPNVVIIILEGFAAEYVGFCNPASHIFTPFLDSIFAESIAFSHTYATGRVSVDATPAVLSSIPKMYDSFVLSSYSTNTLSSIADILNKRGYNTSFFHGAPNGSMGFDSFMHNAKFQHYFGMNEYLADPASDKKAYDGSWGIWDEDFLAYFERSIAKLPEPFLTSVFTVTSHHPFNVPDKYKGKLPEGKVPLCRCIAYTDIALRKFFAAASQEPWFINTIFILVADHTNQPSLPEYSTDEGLFRIPLAFYIPALAKNSDSTTIEYPCVDTTTVASQVDIFPSLMALLGYSEPFFAFGQDIISAKKQHNYAVTFHYPYFQIISLNGYIQFDGKKVVAVKGNIPAAEQQEMVRYLKAYIQQYIVHVLNNTLYCPIPSNSAIK